MKTLLLAGALLGLSTTLPATQARADDPAISIDGRRMLGYGTLKVMVGICKTTLTPDQTAQMDAGLKAAAEAQRDLTQEQFTETMKAVGAQVGQNREQVCTGLTPEFIASSLSDAAAGK